ncbi:MAG: ABC transporter permease [Chloroflexota bacterium]
MTDNALPVKAQRVNVRRFIANNSTLLVLLALLLIFGLTSKNFLLPTNIFNIWRQMAVVSVLAIGMTVVILIGGIDLSVASTLFLAGGVAGWLLQGGMNTPEAILIGLGGATLVGLINGLLVEVAGISPVIATLGMLIGVRGLAQVIMSNAQIRVTDPFFDYIASTRILGGASNNPPGLPLMVVIVFALYLIVALLMRQTIFGRYIYAIGGNEAAARLCGVPVTRINILAYVFCGFTAGIAGMLIIATTGVVSPNLGVGSEFFTIAAVVLGGTRLSGGVGRVEKTLLGAMILYMVLNYMTLSHVKTEWQQAATGLLVLAAVVFDRLAQRGGRS